MSEAATESRGVSYPHPPFRVLLSVAPCAVLSLLLLLLSLLLAACLCASVRSVRAGKQTDPQKNTHSGAWNGGQPTAHRETHNGAGRQGTRKQA
jgi:hypothetical protein